MNVLVINGPNLNMLGYRPKEHYGSLKLDDINKLMEEEKGNLNLEFFQSNSEGDIVTKCVIIIRHNKDLKPNESYIYSVKFIERNEGYYDFEKDEETKSKDIIKIIKERND